MIQILYETMIQVANYDAHTAPPAAAATNGNSTPSRPALTPSAATTPNPTTITTSPPTREVLAASLTQLSTALQAVGRLADAATHNAQGAGPHTSLADVPLELITYVDGGRNPDIYTREFVELVRRENQLMRGKAAAFASFRDVLACEIASANPELRDDVAAVVVGTGGVWPPRQQDGAQ